MNKKAVRIASVVFCLVGAQTATAAERGFYMGGQVGQATKEVSRDFFEVFNDILQEVSNFVPIEEHTSIDDTDIAFSILCYPGEAIADSEPVHVGELFKQRTLSGGFGAFNKLHNT